MEWLFEDITEECEAKTNRFAPRPFQVAAVDAVDDCLRTSDSCYIVQATGTGKTEVAILLRERIAPDDGFLHITPRIELVDQAADRFRSRGVPCGIERAHLCSDELVTVACYDSLLSGGSRQQRRTASRRYEKYLGRVKLVVVDESHMNFTPAAIRMLDAFRANGAKIVGMTATPRVGKKESLSDWYGPCAFTYLYQQARDDGYLVPVKIWLTVLDNLDLSKIPTSCGDYNGEQLARWLKQEGALQAVSSLVEQTYDGKPSMVFAKSIDQAELLADILRRRNIACSVVHSDTNRLSEDERRRNLDDFEAGRTDVIVNVECLALGWDCPKVQKIYIARPTQSFDLYGQIFGRGTRPLPGVVDGLKTADERRAAIAASAKPHFEIYDLCDVTRHNKLVTASDFLNPGMDQKLQRRVRDRQAKSPVGVADIDLMVEQERARLAKEQAALDMIEMSRRARVKADAEYRLYERDAFAPVEEQERRRRYTVMLWGKYKRKPFHEVPTSYIRWTLENCKAPPRHPGYFPALRSEIAKRMTGMR